MPFTSRIKGIKISQETGDSVVYQWQEPQDDHKEDARPYASATWKTTRVEAKPKVLDPKTALLEAKPGPDGVFRVEGETVQRDELERLRKEIGEMMRKDQENINRLIMGMFDSDK